MISVDPRKDFSIYIYNKVKTKPIDLAVSRIVFFNVNTVATKKKHQNILLR